MKGRGKVERLRKSNGNVWMAMLALLAVLAALLLPGKAWATEAKKLSITAGDMALTAGDAPKSIKAKVTKGAAVTYTSSDKSVATVSTRGRVTAKKAGTAIITIKAKKNGYRTAKKTITVTVSKARQTILASDKMLYVGDTAAINATAMTALRYTSSNKNIVTVSSDGVLTGKKKGTATITIRAKSSEVYKYARKTIKVTVKKSVVKAVAAPQANASQSIYAAIPDLGVVYSVGADTVKYGASCTKFIYTYYAYCVKNWGSIVVSYNGYTASIEACAKKVLEESDNNAAHAIHSYLRADSSRWSAYLKWLQKVLGGSVPTMSEGYKYRLGYDSNDAYCPFTTARENSALWQYIYKKGFNKKSARFKNFFHWASASGITSGGNTYTGYTKSGWWTSWSDVYTARTCGGFYIVKLADGKEHAVFLSVMRDRTVGNEGILTGPKAADVALDYMVYLGNKELERQGKLAN